VVLTIAISLALMGMSGAAHAQPESLKDAKQFYVEGTELFKVGKFQEALSQFEQSYEFAASPNASLMIGRCLDRLGELEAAFDWLTRTEFAAETKVKAGEPKYEPTREAARSDLASLRQRLGFIRVVVSGDRSNMTVETAYGGRVPIDGPELELPHRPGDARLKFRRGEQMVVERVEKVVAAGHIDVLVEGGGTDTGPVRPLKPKPDQARPGLATLAGAGVVAGVGVALGAVAVSFGTKANDLYDDLAARCSVAAPCSDPAARDLADKGEEAETITNVFAVLAGAHGLVAGAMLVVGAVQVSSSESVSLQVTPNSASLRLSF
jgi:hypothetical protein